MSLAIRESDFRRWSFCLLLVAFAFTSEARSQARTPSGSNLAPPSSNLVPVHWPDPAQLEPEVRQQLLSTQSTLAAAVKDPATSLAILSEAYGTTGEIYHAYSLISSARECYLNANRLTPKDFRWVYLLGKLDQEEGRVDDALRRYQIAQNSLLGERLPHDFVGSGVSGWSPPSAPPRRSRLVPRLSSIEQTEVNEMDALRCSSRTLRCYRSSWLCRLGR